MHSHGCEAFSYFPTRPGRYIGLEFWNVQEIIHIKGSTVLDIKHVTCRMVTEVVWGTSMTANSGRVCEIGGKEVVVTLQNIRVIPLFVIRRRSVRSHLQTKLHTGNITVNIVDEDNRVIAAFYITIPGKWRIVFTTAAYFSMKTMGSSIAHLS